MADPDLELRGGGGGVAVLIYLPCRPFSRAPPLDPPLLVSTSDTDDTKVVVFSLLWGDIDDPVGGRLRDGRAEDCPPSRSGV